ncbi:MAG: hypothetical protein JW901_02780 [Dehalococcoidia bacterium]|nr:hypothetical protein [Dehalococcoidia bacterium]
MNTADKNKNVIHNVPLVNLDMATLVPSFTAVSKDKNGNIKSKRYGDEELSYSADYKDEVIEESSEISNPKSKSEDRKRIMERRVVQRLLPVFNENNSTNFIISKGEPPQDGIADVFIEGSNTKERKAIQVTISDEKAVAKLGRTKSLSRSGKTYQISSEAIKTRVNAKTSTKYPEALRSKTVLALDGWHGVTKKTLDEFKIKEKDFLKRAGYSQIWFVGTITEEIVRLI